MSQALTKQRLRIQFSKFGPLRFVGHLDLARTWERTLRRANIPLEYTRGYNPRPRLQFASALPLGLSSACELMDIWLTEALDLDDPEHWIERLNATCPTGLRVETLGEVPIKAPALPAQVRQAEYEITLRESSITPEELGKRAKALLAQPAIVRERRGKTYDLRPLIHDLHLDADGRLIARLSTGEKSNARADELVDALGLELHEVRVHRTHLLLEEPHPTAQNE